MEKINYDRKIHEHHRERLREKLFSGANTLNEYEVLELLLYNALPRVNTNDVAHRLISQFGSVSGVLSAPPEMLKMVHGVGPKVASYLATIGLIMRDYFSPIDAFPERFSFKASRQPLADVFARFTREVFLILFLDKHYNIKAKRFIPGHRDSVQFDMNEITEMIVAQKPAFVVVAHNHLSGNPHPSAEDDRATEKLFVLLMLNNVVLLDHLIFSNGKTYSYHFENRLIEIQAKAQEALS